MATPCGPTEPLGDPLSAGGLTGDATDSPDNWQGRTTGRLTDGVTTVRFESVLPLSVVEVLLESLAPFDPEVQPMEVDGPG
jgi:hypothetical protein